MEGLGTIRVCRKREKCRWAEPKSSESRQDAMSGARRRFVPGPPPELEAETDYGLSHGQSPVKNSRKV